MTEVYKFRVSLKGLSDKIWREIEIMSSASVAKLGYAVLAAMDSGAYYLFNISFRGRRYEIVFDDDDIFVPVTDPIATKLAALYLKIGSVLHMEYDYGSGWEFDIELISITPLERGRGGHYPFITGGEGRGIVEDACIDELAEMIEKTDKTGEIPEAYDWCCGKRMPWDYRRFDLNISNSLFKARIYSVRDSYECCDDEDD